MAASASSALFDSLSRIFIRTGSGNSYETIGKGKQTTNAPPSTPTYYSGGISRMPSSLTPDRTRPPRVSWLPPSSGSPSPNRSTSPPKASNRSSPYLDDNVATVRLVNGQGTAVRRSVVSSLRHSGVYFSDSSSARSRPLSPVDEQPRFPKRSSLDSVPATPDSTGEGACQSLSLSTREQKY